MRLALPIGVTLTTKRGRRGTSWQSGQECEVWSVKIWSGECEVWSAECEVWSGECEVWSVKLGV